MQVSTDIITYSDLFDRVEDVDELLNGIDSDAVIRYLCFLNAYLFPYKKEGALERHKEIIRIFFTRLPTKIKLKIDFLIEAKKILFLRPSILEFVQYEFTNYRIVNGFTDTTPEQELNILKVYLIISDKKQEKSFEQKRKDNKYELFYTFFWPFLSYQYDLHQIENPIYRLIKGTLFLNYFKTNSAYTRFYLDFLNKLGCKNGWEYIYKLMVLSQNGFGHTPKFHIEGEDTNLIFKNLIFDHKGFLKNESSRLNYNGLKAGPIFKSRDGGLYIIDWDFLNRKFYDGLIRDFYELTSVHQKFKSFPDFLSKFSKEVSEDILFHQILNACFKESSTELIFDRFPSNHPADCYIRYNQYVFLVEFKNSSFSSKSLDSGSFGLIRGEIDRKMNSWNDYKKRGKGVPQIINQIKNLNETLEFCINSNGSKIKIRNVIIFPIIIYTDKMFGMPGINDYLNTEFSKSLKELNNLKFKKVEDLILLDINFFIRNIERFQYSKIRSLKDLLLDYNSVIQTRKKKHNTKPEIDKYDMLFDNFEDIESTRSPEYFNNYESGFLRNILQTLKIDIF